MPKNSLSFFLLLPILVSFTGHKFYVSHYRIDHKDNSLQITAKIFTDDLEKVISTPTRAYRINEKESTDTLNRVLNAYLQKHLRLKADGSPITLQWVGFEKEADVTWLYLEAGALKKAPAGLHVFCNTLTDVYPDQVNLFNISVNGEKKTFFLNENTQEMQLSFN